MKTITKLIAVTFLLCAAVGGLCTTSYAEIPKLINYQGKLVKKADGAPETGAKSVTFRIYDSQSAPVAQAVWSETQSITLDKGVFAVLLGSTKPNGIDLAFDKPYWIGIQIGTDDEMSQRSPLVSTGYAINSDKLGGKAVTEFSLANHTHDASAINAGTLPVARGGTGVTTSLVKVGTYVGNGVGGKTVAHGLGTTPAIVMIVEDTTNACILYVNGMATYTNAGGIVPMTVDATNITLNMAEIMGNRSGKIYYYTAIRAN